MCQSNSKSFIDNNRDIYTERRIQIKKFGFVICGINWSIGLAGLRKISKIGVLGTILFLPMGMGGGPTVVGSERWYDAATSLFLSLIVVACLFSLRMQIWTSWILGEIVEGDEGCYGKVLVAKTDGGYLGIFNI
jgi:hypothetical protein